MGDHSRSNSHDLLHILGFANFCRACKSFLSKCYPEKPTIFFKKSQTKTKPKSIEDDPRIGRLKYHKSKKHNVERDDDDLRHKGGHGKGGLKQGSNDDDLATRSPQWSPPVSSGSCSGRLSRNMSYHGGRSQAPGHASKGSFSRSLSHKDATIAPPITHTFSRSTSKGVAAPIIFSNSSGLLKPAAMEKQLDCTLEELCFGCIKKVAITREAVKGNGQIMEGDDMVTIKVEPGWRRGTKITFEGKGNRMPGTKPADLIFVVAEKEHSLFKREEDDLQLEVEIMLVDALTGCTLLLPLLGGQTTSLTIQDIVHPGYEQVIQGEGMPKQHDPGTRGNLIVKISVKFPDALTDEQRSTAASILQQPC